jgi:RecB family exonuclease
VPVRPVPRAVTEPRGPTQIAAPDLLEYLRRRTARLSPTALETFLQCPFQYFTQRLMYLTAAPPRPEERLSFLEQGNIVHEVLAEWWNQPQDIAPLFERILARRLEEAHIPDGYHTERLRNAMLDDLKRFAAQDQWQRDGWTSQTEIKFAFPLAEGVEISGRIDRLDVAPDGRAFVLDYKYSAAQRVKDKLENPNLLQAPLYMMAVEHLNVRPAGMFYLGVKGGIEYAGWSETPLMDSLALPENWLETTRENALRIVDDIRRGRIDVLPADLDSCRFCDAKDICRIEVGQAILPAAALQAAPAGEESILDLA